MHAFTASFEGRDGISIRGSQKELQSLQDALDQVGFEFTVHVIFNEGDRFVVFISFVNRQSEEGRKAIETAVAFNELEKNPVEV